MLTWDASVDTNTAGVYLYQGSSSRIYTNRVDCGASNRVTVEIPEVGTNFFAATAYNILGVESDYSDEISYSLPVPPPGPSNVILILSVPMEFSTNLKDWIRTNAVVGIFTNPSGPMRFWRAPGLQVKVEMQ